MSVSQAVARPVRTGTQFVAAAVLVEFTDSFFVDLTDRQYAAALGLLTMVIGYLQVLVENRFGKAFLRKPEPPARPVEVVEDGHEGLGVVPPEAGRHRVDERGAFDNSILISVAAVIVIIAGLVFLAQAL